MGGMNTRGMKERAGLVMLGLALSLVFTGCKKAQTSPSLVCDREGYIQASHAYDADQGEELLLKPSATPIVESYFGKLYNKDWLKAVGRASVLNTIAYIETKGARVYRSDSISTKSAKPMASLSYMPWDIDREWRKADEPYPEEPCGFLSGLYLGSDSRGMPSLRGKGAVVVREDASRWTLVHEFMHHNFKTQAAKNGYDDDVLQNRRIRLLNGIRDLKRNRTISDQAYGLQLSVYFQELMNVADQLVVQYQFEEMAIEATLQDLYERGELGYVPVRAYRNASWYIDHSKKSAEKMYSEMTATYNELFGIISTKQLSEEIPKTIHFPAMRDARLAQAQAVIVRREKVETVKGFARFEASVPEFGSMPCAHAKDVEDQMEAIASALRAPRRVD
jgi:hypothetical protein